jgi:hypothetical protein
VATALVSGALLAFALSFDEVIVTVFTAGAQNTLPLWIFGAIRQGQQLPQVNAVVTIVILLTLIPVVLAAGSPEPARSRAPADRRGCLFVPADNGEFIEALGEPGVVFCGQKVPEFDPPIQHSLGHLVDSSARCIYAETCALCQSIETTHIHTLEFS